MEEVACLERFEYTSSLPHQRLIRRQLRVAIKDKADVEDEQPALVVIAANEYGKAQNLVPLQANGDEMTA